MPHRTHGVTGPYSYTTIIEGALRLHLEFRGELAEPVPATEHSKILPTYGLLFDRNPTND